METRGSSIARKAFRGNADKGLIVTYEAHRAAHRYISSALEEANGIAILQGPRGAGKTTIINELVPLLTRESPTAVFDGANLAAQPHVRNVLPQFGIDVGAEKDDQLLQTLNTFARHQADLGTAPVLIVDNADRLEPSALSLLNWLAALDVRERWAIQFVLTGTERLAELVADYSMRYFERRHPAVFNMNPLSRREAVIYLRTKFIVAGGENAEDVLSLDACDELHELSRGWPGRLNDLAMQTIDDIGENRDTQSGPRIVVSNKGKIVAEFILTKSETIIGRDKTADIVIDDFYVSKRHAMLQLDETAVVLFDLNSTNGTRVNSTDTMHSVLRNNDIISIGQYRLKIESLPVVSDEMAERIRRADTLTLDDPEDIRRSRAKRNIRRSRIGNNLPVAPHSSPSNQSYILRKSSTQATQ
jgi:type II secretory pathway predicted ATPase ExeA/pSer/pThr/pTyr-binding forkhead associated (FHA) protein